MKEVTLMGIFRSTFVLSAFTIGGGYMIVPLMENKMVNELGRIDSQEIMDMVAVGQSSPGAIAFDEFKSNQFIQTMMTRIQVSVAFVIFSSVYKMAKDSFKINKINGVKALVYSLISMIASLY